MSFQHAPGIWAEYPELVAGALFATGIHPDIDTGAAVARYAAAAMDRLVGGSESDLPEIQAWRRAFARMGLRPTQYRCASESLLRRLRKEGALPHIHPLVDLCNAISVAYAIPVAALDVDRITGRLEVRHAAGDERYLTFGGEIEQPEPGEVTFVDAAGQAHARRWTNRQSGHSAVRKETGAVLIVAEAMHETARDDVPNLLTALTDELDEVQATALLTPAARRFEFPGSP
jgi:DNA/RNA-binding domain of Phe-tRNA-synthetase-like protein